MISRNATDAVMAALDDAKVIAWRSDSQYEALCMAVHDAISGQVDASIAAKDAEIARLREEIAQLCGYDNAQEMDSDANRAALTGGGA